MLTVKEKLEYLKTNKGVSYTFIAKKIGTTYNRLNRSVMDRKNKNYRPLSKECEILLNEFFKEYSL